MVNGYQVTSTVQEATGYAVWGLLLSPQLTWRWEIGGGTPSTSPPGVYLSDDELASQVSFFMTDGPPDDMLLAAAKAGTLRANLASQVSRLLMSQPAKDWLRHVMELYFLINQLPTVDGRLDGSSPTSTSGMTGLDGRRVAAVPRQRPLGQQQQAEGSARPARPRSSTTASRPRSTRSRSPPGRPPTTSSRRRCRRISAPAF